jgi:hypothetical protein
MFDTSRRITRRRSSAGPIPPQRPQQPRPRPRDGAAMVQQREGTGGQRPTFLTLRDHGKVYVADLPRPDFIKLDIQGAELMVLQNGRMALSRALVVESEALFVPLYHDQPLFGELHAFMRGEGFLFHRFMNVAGRCYRPFATNDPAVPISQPLWADAVFVRNPLALEGWPTADLLVGAALLHEMYGSYDLVLRLLAEHDRRASTSFGSEYVAALQRLGSVASCFLSLENVPT